MDRILPVLAMNNSTESSMARWEIREGDALELLRTMPDESVRACVTSPPYWGLRDYDGSAQIGLEQSLSEYVRRLVAVFAEVRRVLADDGTVWLNLGDSYCSQGGAGGTMSASGLVGGGKAQRPRPEASDPARFGRWNRDWGGLKPKDLVGMPWRVAFALQDDGWWLRSDIIWSKPNPMPESVTDRPTRAHEFLFLLAKSRRYFYDSAATREGDAGRPAGNVNGFDRGNFQISRGDQGHGSTNGWTPGTGRNKRDVWEIPTRGFPGAHFAVFPTDLAEPCVLAGSEPGDMILDPFCGSGTVGLVALRHERSFVGLELNADYVELARRRICDDAPLLNTGAEHAPC